MAIDTETKRRGVPNIPPITINPVPDGAISNVDRMQVTGWYAGITPQSPTAGNVPIFGLENGEYTIMFGGQVVR